jgi:carbonic anhydrase
MALLGTERNKSSGRDDRGGKSWCQRRPAIPPYSKTRSKARGFVLFLRPAVARSLMDCDEAMLRLISGNQRFVRGESVHPHEEREWRLHLGAEQHPFATILGCSGSQAPPELVFDQGLGDLHVIRVAGNVVSSSVLGSIQFGGAYLGTRLFVVLGHHGCDVVRAALEERAGRSRQPGQIQDLMRLIQPALDGLSLDGDFGQQLNLAVEGNVRWSVKQLREMPEARKAVRDQRVKIIGAVCQLPTGVVRFLD